MTGVAVASSSQLAADVGAAVAGAGGNAVDVAIATCLTSMTTEPGVCSLGGSGYITIWPADRAAVTIDGYAEMPGRGLPPERLGKNAREIEMAYGGGMRTIVGFGSIATPGCIAAFGLASSRHGRLPWKELVMPAAHIANTGFPLPSNCRHYLQFSLDPIYGWQPHGREILVGEDGNLPEAGDIVRIPGLHDTLSRIGELGPEEFYTGELGHYIADYVFENGGALNRDDMAAYRAVERPSLDVPLDSWHIATSPPPAIGGATLAAMLYLMNDVSPNGWTPEAVRRMAEAQQTVIDYRHKRLDDSETLEADIAALLESTRASRTSCSQDTVHTSAVDAQGTGCSITMSAGYGSGALPPGTGCWLNNSLGEVELSPSGLKVAAPGTRLTSNMAPSVARRADGTVLAAGSPGADRITTAMLQVLVNYIHFHMDLGEAVGHPRAHLESTPQGYRVAHEPGLPMDLVDMAMRHFDDLSMFFGGVACAEWSPDSGFTVAGDPRRHGGTAIVRGE